MVSVIVPVYNAEKYIRHCLESICSQTYSDLEIVLVNDGSKDNSLSILQEYAKKDSRIHVIDQENKGVSSARNNGLRNVNGDYILFVDSDDWIEPDMISILISNLQKSQADISCCQYDHGTVNDIGEYEVWNKDTFIEAFLIHKKLNGSLVNKLFQKKVIVNELLDESIKYGEDALFLWKLLFRSSSLVITNQVLYHVSLHDDSASGGGSYKPIRRDCIKVWKAISSDAEKMNPHFYALSKVQLANMAFFSIYQMAYYNYDDRNDEKLFIEALKENWDELNQASFIKRSEKVMSKCMLFNLTLPKLLIRIRSKIRR